MTSTSTRTSTPVRMRLKQHTSAISILAIVAVLLASLAYIFISVLRVDPLTKETTATIQLSDSGGLQVSSPVLLTGYTIGEVTAISTGAEGVTADIRYREDFPIPADATLTIRTLSALGEPYLEFTPTGATSSYLTAGAVVDARGTDAAVSLTQTATEVSELIEQFDPEVLANLVDTFGTALADTDAVIPQLGRSTRLLAVTVMTRLPKLAALLTAIQSMGTDIDWLGPTLYNGGPAWFSVGTKVIEPLDREMAALTEVQPASNYLTGDGVVPFLVELEALLVEIGPEVTQLAPVLTPVVNNAANNVANLNIGTLVAQALRLVEPDGGLRVQINVQPPAGK